MVMALCVPVFVLLCCSLGLFDLFSLWDGRWLGQSVVGSNVVVVCVVCVVCVCMWYGVGCDSDKALCACAVSCL